MKLEQFKKLEIGFVILLFLDAGGLSLPGALGPLWNRGMKLLAYALIPGLFLAHWKRVPSAISKNLPLLLLTALAVTSILWSATPGKTVDFSRALVRTTLFGIYLATRFNLKEQMRLLIYSIGVLVILSICVSILIPSQGLQFYNGEVVWRGVFPHKNDLARMMSISVFLFACVWLSERKNKLLPGLMCMLSFVPLIMSKGTTALLIAMCSVFVITFYVFLHNQYKSRTILIILGSVLVTATVVLITTNLETIVVDILGKSLTLSGRDELWSASLYKAYQRPVLGYGYGGFWANPYENYFVDSQTWAKNPTHAHNGFIDLFLQLGFTGLGLFFLSLFVSLARITQLLILRRNVEYFFFFVFLISTLAFNYTIRGTILNESHLFWVLFISVSCSGGLEKRLPKRPNRALAESSY